MWYMLIIFLHLISHCRNLRKQILNEYIEASGLFLFYLHIKIATDIKILISVVLNTFSAKIWILFHFFEPIFLTFHFHPLYLHPLFLSFFLNTYQFYLFAYNGNYRLELLYTADKFPPLFAFQFLSFIFFFSRFPYNYICRILSKSKFILKPSTLSDKSKK